MISVFGTVMFAVYNYTTTTTSTSANAVAVAVTEVQYTDVDITSTEASAVTTTQTVRGKMNSDKYLCFLASCTVACSMIDRPVGMIQSVCLCIVYCAIQILLLLLNDTFYSKSV